MATRTDHRIEIIARGYSIEGLRGFFDMGWIGDEDRFNGSVWNPRDVNKEGMSPTKKQKLRLSLMKKKEDEEDKIINEIAVGLNIDFKTAKDIWRTQNGYKI